MSVAALQGLLSRPVRLVLFDTPWSPDAKARRAAWSERFVTERKLVRFVDCFQDRVAAERADVKAYPTVALVTEEGQTSRCFTSGDLAALLRWADAALDDLKQYTTRD